MNREEAVQLAAQIVEEMPPAERGHNGYGSSGR